MKSESKKKVAGAPPDKTKAEQIADVLNPLFADVMNAVAHTETQRSIILQIFQAHAKRYADKE